MKKFQSILVEGKKEFPQKVIDEIRSIANRNDHNAARALIAKTIKNKKMADAYNGFKAINAFFGGTSVEMSQERYRMDKFLFSYLEKQYSNAEDVFGVL